MKTQFEQMMEGLNDVEAFLAGKQEGFKAHVPQEVDVKEIRTRLGMTQAKFSDTFGFSLDAIKHWEGGRRTPEAATNAPDEARQAKKSRLLRRSPLCVSSMDMAASFVSLAGAWLFQPFSPHSNYWPGAFSRLKLHTPLVGCAESVGGVRYDGELKLKNSSMSSLWASREVNGGRLKRVSINLRIAVWSRFT